MWSFLSSPVFGKQKKLYRMEYHSVNWLVDGLWQIANCYRQLIYENSIHTQETCEPHRIRPTSQKAHKRSKTEHDPSPKMPHSLGM